MKWKSPFTPMIIQLDDVLSVKDNHLVHPQGAVMNFVLDLQVRVVLQKHVILACVSVLEDYHSVAVEYLINLHQDLTVTLIILPLHLHPLDWIIHQ